MVDLSIIILNFNTKKLLKDCLRSIVKSDVGNYKIEIIIVDNASTDGSAKMAESLISTNLFKRKNIKFSLTCNKKNLGFAVGNNKGIRETRGRYVLLLNSDTRVYKETFAKMIRFMDESPNWAAATCKVTLPNRQLDWACHRGFPNPWNAFCYFSGLEKLFPKFRLTGGYHQKWKNLKKTHQVDVISGAFFFIRKKVIEKVGLLDEDFFMYGEDIDWCFRIKEKDFRIAFAPITKITHVKGRSGKLKKTSNKNDRKIKKESLEQFFETMKLFYKKHYSQRYPKFLMKLVFKGIDHLKKKKIK